MNFLIVQDFVVPGCADKLIGPAFLNNYSFSDSRPSLSLIKV